MNNLKLVLQKYQKHPDFLGIELINANQRGAVDDTPLHIASRKGDVADIDVLVEHGADVNLSGDLGNTPLHQAAMTGKVESVQRLLELGAIVDVLNEFEQTALDVARLGNHVDVVMLLARRK
jgi:ankyrin repeat protein